jgi:hypothetical protein
MVHANRSRDACISSLYAASAEFYGGEFDVSSKTFCKIYSDLLSEAGCDDTATRLAARMRLACAGPDPRVPDEYLSDPWIRLSLGMDPQSGYPATVYRYIHSGGKTQLPDPETPRDHSGASHAKLIVAEDRVSALPEVNTDLRQIVEETEFVTASLREGEALGRRGGEFELMSKWFIGRSLLLRGRLFLFNGNALMAEGMFRAAGDLATVHPPNPRLATLQSLASHALGDLLVKWEKREAEGDRIKSLHPLPPPSGEIRRFIPEPVIAELDQLE